MSITTVAVHRLVATARVVTIGSALLVDDRTSTIAEETTDDAPHQEGTRTPRRHLDENRMATTLTREARHHPRGDTPTLMYEMVIRTLEGLGVHQEQVMEVATQPTMTEDTSKVPTSIHGSMVLASLEPRFSSLFT